MFLLLVVSSKSFFRLSYNFSFSLKGTHSLDCSFCGMSFLLLFVYSGVCKLILSGSLPSFSAFSVPCSVILQLSPSHPGHPSPVTGLRLAAYDLDTMVILRMSHSRTVPSLWILYRSQLQVCCFPKFSYSHCPTIGIGQLQGVLFQPLFMGRRVPIIPQGDWLWPIGNFRLYYFSGYPFSHLHSNCT